MIDWHVIARAAGLTRLETRILLKHWRDGVPVYQLPQLVGCSPAEAARARQSVAEKLSARRADSLTSGLSLEPVRDSLRVAYRDHLPSGRRPWAIAGLSEYFVEIMNEEKCFGLIPQQDPGEFQKSRRFCPVISRNAISQNTEVLRQEAKEEQLRIWSRKDFMPKELKEMPRQIDSLAELVQRRSKLETELRAEGAKLELLLEGHEMATSNAKTLQVKVATLRILAHQEPTPERVRQLRQCESELADSERIAREYPAGIDRQRQIIAGLEANVIIVRRDEFATQMVDAKKRLNAALTAFLDASRATVDLISRYPLISADFCLFPPTGDDLEAHASERTVAASLVYTAANLARSGERYEVGREWRVA